MTRLQGPPPRGVPHDEFVRRKRAERRQDRALRLLLGHGLRVRGEIVMLIVCVVALAAAALLTGADPSAVAETAVTGLVLAFAAAVVAVVVVRLARRRRPDSTAPDSTAPGERSLPLGLLVLLLITTAVLSAVAELLEGRGDALVAALGTVGAGGSILAAALLVSRIARIGLRGRRSGGVE